MRYTVEERQRILNAFTKRHGKFDRGLFLSEVQATGESHPAWGWFDWDDADAAHKHRLAQATAFVRDLVIETSVKVIRHDNLVIKTVQAPAVVSPTSFRNYGGGYIVTDLNKPAVVDALCHEAANNLRAWIRRYGGLVDVLGGSTKEIENMALLLESHQNKDAAE